MMTEKLIWFVDCRFYYQTTSLDKMVRLADAYRRKIKIIFDASAQLKGRGYWHLFDDKEKLSQALLEDIKKKQEQLIKYFNMNAIKVEIAINQSTDYLKTLNNEINEDVKSVVVIEDSIMAKRHSIFQKLTEINTSVLILSHNTWKPQVSILAAIDPLHEHERPEKVDQNIVSQATNWSLSFKADWTAAHCYYVDGIMAKYKNKVQSIHRDALNQFSKTHRLPENRCILLEGTPEYALSSYINKYRVDILIIGLVSRNKLQQAWIGSTSTALLSAPPCDLLFIKK